ncbi:hypothetical protein ISTM_33 [Insectomime virus]|nr:hypothetical protein ISTM_33 [Insectomime virus]
MESSILLEDLPFEVLLHIFEQVTSGADFYNLALVCSLFCRLISNNKKRLCITTDANKIFDKSDVMLSVERGVDHYPYFQKNVIGTCSLLLNGSLHGVTSVTFGDGLLFHCEFVNDVLHGHYEYDSYNDSLDLVETVVGTYSHGERVDGWRVFREGDVVEEFAYHEGNLLFFRNRIRITIYSGPEKEEYNWDHNIKGEICENTGEEMVVFVKDGEEYAHCCEEHQREMPNGLD